MGRYLTKRILKGLLVILVSITVTFFILRLMPADPASIFIDPKMTPEVQEELRRQMGLDKPIWQQYFIYIGQLLQGDLGISFRTRLPVSEMIMQKLPWTLLLMFSVVILSLAVGIPLGIASAKRQNSWFDRAVNIAVIIGVSMFIPFVSIGFLYLFGYLWHVLPTGGAYTPPPAQGFAYIIDVAKHTILPTITLFLVNVGTIVLYSRNSMVDVLKEDYIRTARSKGWKDSYIIRHHALKNALIPTMTATGIMIGNLVGGAIMTETIYSWPGIGRLIYESVAAMDFPVLQGAFLMLAVTVVVMSILTDIVISLLDPRIKLGGK